MGAALDIQLLGRFRLSIEGEPTIDPTSERLQSLIGYLLLHAGVPQSRVHLAFVFWPDASEVNGRNSLRQLLHQLRRVLPNVDQHIKTDANSIEWITDTARVDVSEFEVAMRQSESAKRSGDLTRYRHCLERGLSLCHGPLLPSCFDDWVIAPRQRFVQQCNGASSGLVSLLEQQREYAAAIGHVRHWLDHDPLDEAAHRWLMRLLALSGDRISAMSAHRKFVEALRRELSTEPSVATVRVFESIRNAQQAPTVSSRNGDSRRESPPLVARHAEWMALRAAWNTASEGQCSFVVIKGDAGIGKSRLAEELATWAEAQGINVAKTRCYAAEGRLSLAPVRDWLSNENILPQLSSLESIWRTEIARILPALGGESGKVAASHFDFGDRLRFFEALCRAVRAVAPPVILIIDDLQWCDVETLEWLHFLARFDPRARILVVGTVRAEVFEPTHSLETLLCQLRSVDRLVEIALEPLDAAECAALATYVAESEYDSEMATRLYQETEGNPLFVVEIVRAKTPKATSRVAPEARMSSLPSRVYAVISGRLAQLSQDARAVAAAAAAVGRAFDAELLAQVVGDRALVLSALDELWRKRIIREHGATEYDFTHDKLREVAYAEMSVPQRRDLHRRIAQALVAAHGSNLDPVCAQIAAHCESSGLLEEAVPQYLRASGVAQRVYAHDDTMALAERGLSLLQQLSPDPRFDALELEFYLVLAPSTRITKGWAAPELGDILERARELGNRVGTPSQRVAILYGLQSFALVSARLESAALTTEELARALHEVEGGEPPSAVRAMLAGLRILTGRFEEASREIDDLMTRRDPIHTEYLQQSQGSNYEVHVRVWQSHALWCLGLADTALERAQSAARVADELQQPFSRVIAANYLALLQQLRADAQTFRWQATRALELASEFKTNYYSAWASILVAYAGTFESPGPLQLQQLQTAIEQFKQTGARLRLPYYLALLADAHLRAHHLEAGLAVLDEAFARSRETNESWWDAELHRLRAELRCEQNATIDETQATLMGAIEIARVQGAQALELRAATSLAQQWRIVGRTQAARELLQPITARFCEGLSTPDFVRAVTLLGTLDSVDQSVISSGVAR